MKEFFDHPLEIKKARIKNALTLPLTVLQLMLTGKIPPKEAVEDANKSINEAIKLVKKL